MRRFGTAGGALCAGTLLFLTGIPGAEANHEPANKAAVSGSTTEVIGPQEEVELLQATVKTSTPADLLLAVTLECSIVTDVTTVGNDDSSATSTVEVWIEVDGNPVFVANDDASGGRVVFCNRKYQRRTSMFDDEDATIETFFSTRSTHGFNWFSLNVGSGTHDIRVKATLSQETSGDATAEAVVGNRTLLVDTLKAANDEEVAPADPTPAPEPEDEGVVPGVL